VRASALADILTSSQQSRTALISAGQVDRCIRHFGPDSTTRKRIDEYRFCNLKLNVVPAYLRVLSWSINQRVADNANWDSILGKKLNLSDEQKSRLGTVLSSKPVNTEESCLERLRMEEMSSKVNHIIKEHAVVQARLAEHQQNMLKILSQDQTVKYFQWIEWKKSALAQVFVKL